MLNTGHLLKRENTQQLACYAYFRLNKVFRGDLIVRPRLPESCRVICVSDIHTHWKELEALLQKCRYRAGEVGSVPKKIISSGE